MRRNALGVLLAAGWVLGGCAHQPIALPMTSEELASAPGTSGLITYLEQPDADPESCARAGASLARATRLPAEMTSALVDGQVSPEAWGACVSLLLPRLDAAQASRFADEIVRAAAEALAHPRAEPDPTLRVRRLRTLARVYLDRAPGDGASDGAARALDEARQRATGADELRAAGHLALGLELERGRWEGRAVDAATLDRMASRVGVVLLERAAHRLLDPALRAKAERLLVRQRIAASPFPEVRSAAEAVETAVLRQGSNPVSLTEHRPLHAEWAGAAPAPRTVVVRQRPMDGTAVLLARATNSTTPTLLPTFSLRDSLEVWVTGISRPLTVCAPNRALDPAPCISPSDIILASPLARVLEVGALRISERVSESAAVELVRSGSVLRVPLSVGPVSAGALVWSVAFERPPDVVLSGSRPGEAGPHLTVIVERIDASHLLYTVQGGEAPITAVLETGGAHAFHVVSRGAPGADGAPGSDGTDGTSGIDGTDASCPGLNGTDGASGSDGSSGQSGFDGFPGGRGGDVQVVVVDAGQRADTLELARASVASEGGPGGRGGLGGRGGRGGEGGRGGAGMTCTDSDGLATRLSGGMPGSRGLDGWNGTDGRNGPTGEPGAVRFEVRPRANP